MRVNRLGPLFAIFLLATLAGCTHAATPTGPPPRPSVEAPSRRLTPAPNVPGDPSNGQRLFIATGCGGCHTLTGLSNANGVAGPNLANIVLRPTLAGETIPMSPEALARFILDPAATKPGSPMPSVGLTEQEARDIAAFLYSQPYNPGE